jgi:hypothetical protein
MTRTYRWAAALAAAVAAVVVGAAGAATPPPDTGHEKYGCDYGSFPIQCYMLSNGKPCDVQTSPTFVVTCPAKKP